MADRRCKQATISRAKLRARHLAEQNLELVVQDQQLKVLDVHAAATPNERAPPAP
jgi:phage gp46-like protein